MIIFQIGFVVLIVVFGLLFIRRNRDSSTLKNVAIVLVLILGMIISFDKFIDNGFGYSTPIEVEIVNKTNSDLKVFGVLTGEYCNNASFVYGFGKIKSNEKSLKTIEADCGYDFSILAFNDLNEIVYAEKMDIDKKLSLQIISIDRLKKNDKDLYLMYKDKIDEFEVEENERF